MDLLGSVDHQKTLLHRACRYLRAGGGSDWLERDAPEELGGLDRKHTRYPLTRGLLMWPEIFEVCMDESNVEHMVIT